MVMKLYCRIINLPLAAVILLACAEARAAFRMPEELMDEQRSMSNLEGLLMSPLANMKHIEALYLSPLCHMVPIAVEAIRSALASPRGLEDRTALHILLATALRNREIFAKMPNPKNGSPPSIRLPGAVIDALLGEGDDNEARPGDAGEDTAARPDLAGCGPDSVAMALLADFNELKGGQAEGRLLDALFKCINVLLADADIAGKLTDGDRQSFLDGYIRSELKPLAKCPPRQVVAICRNLGLDVHGELDSFCAIGPKGGEAPSELDRKMNIATFAGMETEAIACADRLLEIGHGMLEAWIHDDVVTTYAAFRPLEALEKFRGQCAYSPVATIAMYRTACSCDQHGDENERRREWLDCFIDRSEEICMENGAVDKERHVGIMNSLALQLEWGGCPEAAVYVAHRILEKADLGAMPIVYVMDLLFRCNKALGREADTREAFARCLEDSRLHESARSFASKRLEEIGIGNVKVEPEDKGDLKHE